MERRLELANNPGNFLKEVDKALRARTPGEMQKNTLSDAKTILENPKLQTSQMLDAANRLRSHVMSFSSDGYSIWDRA